jgi:imidazole glycerol-phosphate synthase subunit HisH
VIAIVDSGVANLASVTTALQRLGVTFDISADAKKIASASHVILPGVGAAVPAMAQLHKKNLVNMLRSLTQPLLGICLGMQLLFSRSDEGGGTDCLAIIPGHIERLIATSQRPVPHMGWNQLNIKKHDHPLLNKIADKSFTYFVHSYVAPLSDSVLASTDYGQSFASIVGYKNYFGCQFHPERSSSAGSQLLKNFITM